MCVTSKKKVSNYFIVMSGFWYEMINPVSHVIPQVCYARVLDYRRKFIEAAQRYLDLSYKTAIHDEERMTALKHALICTMLASAGL